MRCQFIVFLLFITSPGRTQPGIKWKYSVKKLSENTCEIHMTAHLSPSWHIYSQHMDDGGPLPTSIRFDPNPSVELIDSIREMGRPIIRHENVFDMNVTYYTDSVDFVQKVILRTRAPAATRQDSVISLSGAINFMICKEDQCLAPTGTRFTLPLQCPANKLASPKEIIIVQK